MNLFVLIMALMGQAAGPTLDASHQAPRATIFATVGHSEWCPAGKVSLDLTTGDYLLTRTLMRSVCNERGLERPTVRGRLDEARVAKLRSIYRDVLAAGLDVCRDGRRPERIVVSNGGKRGLVLTSEAGTKAAPDDITCWSDPAHAMHKALEDAFAS